MRNFLINAILLFFSISSFAQKSNLEKEQDRLFRRQMLLQSDSIHICRLNGTCIKSDFGNFNKNDTVHYSNGAILRTSEASNGYLNGSLIYYNKEGKIWIKAKLKDNEYCDTMFNYHKSGYLQSMTVYTGSGKRTITDYYDTGEIKRISEIEVVDEDEKALKENPSLPRQKMKGLSDQYFDKSGKKITEKEYQEYLQAEWRKNNPNK